MTKDSKNCKHDFLAVLHCKKCGKQYHTNWTDALVESKLDAVAEVLQRTKTTIGTKSVGEDKEKAIKIALDAIGEVKKVYKESIKKQNLAGSDNQNQLQISRLPNLKK